MPYKHLVQTYRHFPSIYCRLTSDKIFNPANIPSLTIFLPILNLNYPLASAVPLCLTLWWCFLLKGEDSSGIFHAHLPTQPTSWESQLFRSQQPFFLHTTARLMTHFPVCGPKRFSMLIGDQPIMLIWSFPFFFLFSLIFIYLAVSSLSCSMQNLF